MGRPYTHSPASNTAAIVTIPASTDIAHEIEMIAWSYDGDPTAGNLKVESNSVTLFEIDITNKGPGFIMFSGSCLKGTPGYSVVVTLAAGGSGVSGIVNAIKREA